MNALQKYILLTGATGGIGSATALALARKGVSLFLSARNTVALEALKHQVSLASGQKPGVSPADLPTRTPSPAVVNAAGAGVVKPVENITAEERTAARKKELGLGGESLL